MRRFTLLLVLMAMVVAACSPGGTADQTTTTAAPTTTTTTTAPTTTTTEAVAEDFPVTIDTHNGPVTIESRPERIVSLSPTHTEMLFAIGAGLQVVAVDSLSSYPADAPVTDLSGFTPNLEAILAFEPDLVVALFDPDNMLAEGLGAVGIPLVIWYDASDLDDVFDQMRALGSATGNLELAEKVVDEMQSAIDEIVADANGVGEGVTFFHEVSWDFGFYAASSYSITGYIYTLFGMVNIADEADSFQSGYPEMSPEFVVATDPDMIFLVYSDPATVGDRPGWADMSAVVNDAIVAVDEDTSSRWGPRLVDFAREIGAALGAHG